MKLFVFDIHGTILDNGYELEEKLSEKLKLISQRGDKLALASGHHWNRIEPIAKKYDIPFISIANTGAQIKDPNDSSLEVYSSVSLEVKTKFIENANKYPCFIYVHDKDSSYISTYNDTYEKLNELAVPVYESELVSNEKIESIIKNNEITQISIKTYPEHIENIYKDIKPTSGEKHRLEKIMNLFVDCGSIKTSKGTGVMEIAKKYLIDKKDIFVFGDDINDLSMIKITNNSAAMGNAINKIKEEASFITTSNDENGVLNFINNLEIREKHMKNIKGVYAITDKDDPKRRSLVDQVKDFIKAGVTVIQYRNKNGLPEEKTNDCLEIRKLTKDANVTFIVNDSIDLAIKVNADGLHIGQDDGDAREIRKKIPGHMLLGLSISNLSELEASKKIAADYYGVGALFNSKTKPNAKTTHFYEVEKIVGSNVPCVAIGGINKENIKSIKDMGFKAYCIISDLLSADNTKEYVENINKNII